MSEEFNSLKHCNRRLKAFALAQGFDIMQYGRDIKATLAYRFKCFYYNITTQNNRGLENRVKIDKEGNITSKR